MNAATVAWLADLNRPFRDPRLQGEPEIRPVKDRAVRERMEDERVEIYKRIRARVAEEAERRAS